MNLIPFCRIMSSHNEIQIQNINNKNKYDLNKKIKYINVNGFLSHGFLVTYIVNFIKWYSHFYMVNINHEN